LNGHRVLMVSMTFVVVIGPRESIDHTLRLRKSRKKRLGLAENVTDCACNINDTIQYMYIMYTTVIAVRLFDGPSRSRCRTYRRKRLTMGATRAQILGVLKLLKIKCI
jgi:hypothetical protein